MDSRGAIKAAVSGTRLYVVEIKIDTLPKDAWARLKANGAGKVGSLMDLLQGRLAAPVMEVVTRRDGGLFPKPKEIHLECSCPDCASLCKHVAATLYGVGARLDEHPELLFVLRGVDHLELIASAADAVTEDLVVSTAGGAVTLDESSLTDIFGIEIAPAASKIPAAAKSPKSTAHATRQRNTRRTTKPPVHPAAKKLKVSPRTTAT